MHHQPAPAPATATIRYRRLLSPAAEEHRRQFMSRLKTSIKEKEVIMKKAKGLCHISSLLQDKKTISIELIILTSEDRTKISQKTLDKASEYDIKIITLSESSGFFKSLKDKWFGLANSELAINDPYKKKLRTILDSLCKHWTSQSYLISKLKDYNVIRALFDNADFMPEIVSVVAVPEDLKASGVCNIYNKIMHYETKFAKIDSVPTIEVLKKLPSTDLFGKSFKESVTCLSEETKHALISDPKKALVDLELQIKLLHVEPDDIDDTPSCVLCKPCGVSMSDIKSYIENINQQDLGINNIVFNSTKIKNIADIYKALTIKCPNKSCKSVISWNKLITLYHQSCAVSGYEVTDTDKAKFRDLEKDYIIQALRSCHPDKIKFCKNDECEGRNGMIIMNRFNSHRIECIHCYSTICNVCDLQGSEYHFNQPCRGFLYANMDEESANSLIALGMQMCPGCKSGVLKLQWCDHITCPTPNCGTHFCYRCGGKISELGMAAHNCQIQVPARGLLEIERQNPI